MMGPGIGPDDFLGHWSLTRRIEDRLSGQISRFDGVADIVAQDAQWLYSEAGVLVLSAGQAMQAERRYHWRPVRQGAVISRIDIHFEDGRFFHQLDLSTDEKTPEAQHWCDPDAYQVRYDLTGWPRWSSSWQVRGPRKDYRMTSEYKRSNLLG